MTFCTCLTYKKSHFQWPPLHIPYLETPATTHPHNSCSNGINTRKKRVSNKQNM